MQVRNMTKLMVGQSNHLPCIPSHPSLSQMKRPNLILVLLLGSLATVSIARADIEFTGILTSDGKSTFALADTATTDTRWLTVGKSFSGWKITAYDPKTGVLTLTKDSATKSLSLKGAVIQSAKATRLSVTGDVNIKMGDSAITGAITLVDGTTNSMILPNGVIVQVTPTVQPNGYILYKASFIGSPNADGSPGQVLGQPSAMAMPSMAFNVEMDMPTGVISFGFNPKPAAGNP